MLPNPACPVCSSESWEVIGQRCYRKPREPQPDGYRQRRLRVLFEVWCPGAVEVVLKSLLCQRCGFVIYAPRPTEEDLDAKYRFLGCLGKDDAAPGPAQEIEVQRSARLFGLLSPYLQRPSAKVLDFGGGDARLMAPFAAVGISCSVIDYCPNPIPGVRRLGSTIQDLPPESRFDAIVCSHVLEHLASPREVLARLRGHLEGKGVLYVEVPMEIWRRAPLQDEPVTHVNFFTPSSLRCCLEAAWYRVIRCRMERYRHPMGHHTVVVRALAHPLTRPPDRALGSSARSTRRLLAPGPLTRLRMAALRPEKTRAIFGRVVSLLTGAHRQRESLRTTL